MGGTSLSSPLDVSVSLSSVSFGLSASVCPVSGSPYPGASLCPCPCPSPALTTARPLSLGRGLLGRPGCRDSELLRQCHRSEQVLWGLPCSWVQVPAHAWGHSEELAKVVRGRILQEQARLVWVERGSGGSGGGSSEA